MLYVTRGDLHLQIVLNTGVYIPFIYGNYITWLLQTGGWLVVSRSRVRLSRAGDLSTDSLSSSEIPKCIVIIKDFNQKSIR